MKFYIATKFERKDEVRKICDTLKQNGHSITADWTAHKSIKPYSQNKETAGTYAGEDINGVLESDVFVLVTGKEDSSGAFVELGAAVALNIINGRPKIFVIGENTERSIFYFHKSIKRRNSIEEVLEELKD